MSYKFSFVDNEIYSASDVNAITKRLVTSGIEDSFTDGVAYNVSKFNEAGKLLYTSGVVPETCTTLKVVAAEEGTILINPGMAFFDDGSVIEIEEGGESMSYVTGAKNYVYLKNDLINSNISYPYCGIAEPTGDCVILAEISENGVITDKRTYAKGKLPGYQSVAGNVLYFNETMEVTLSGSRNGEGDASFNIGGNNFEYVLAIDFADNSSRMPVASVYRISDGKIISFHALGDTEAVFDNDEMGIYFDTNKKRYDLTLSLTDGMLNIHAAVFSPSKSIGNAGDKINIGLNFIFI